MGTLRPVVLNKLPHAPTSQMFSDPHEVLEKLVCNRLRVQRLLAKCTAYPGLRTRWAKQLDKKIVPMYDKRWSEVYHFCLRLSEVLPLLQHVWDGDLFEGEDLHGSSALDEFNASDITPLLSNMRFKCYIDMVLRLNDVLESFSAWAEQCPCHGHLQEQYKGNTPAAILRTECGQASGELADLSCPLRSCRAPELADGALYAHLDAQCEGVVEARQQNVN